MRIHVGHEVANGKKTAVVKKNLNPEWNEHFEIIIREKQRTEKLKIEVFDKDMIGKDDSLGSFSIDLSSLNLQYTATEDPLTRWHPLEHGDGSSGQGELLMSYQLVKRISGEQGAVKKQAEGFHAIMLKVWDYDMGTFGTDDFLGQVALPCNLLAPDETLDKWFDLEPRPEMKGKVIFLHGAFRSVCFCYMDSCMQLKVPSSRSRGRAAEHKEHRHEPFKNVVECLMECSPRERH